MDFKGKKVLVFGSGISGIASAGLLINKDADVILYDGNASLDADKIRMDILSKNKNDDRSESGLQVILGEFPAEIINELDLLVISPGVPADLPIVEEIKGKGIPVWGEIELAYVCGKGDVLAITGTNGKTTTTALLGEIMKNYRENTFVVGNIGTPYAGVAGDTTEDSIIVAEMSSFQLETIHIFAPRVSAILNLSLIHI